MTVLRNAKPGYSDSMTHPARVTPWLLPDHVRDVEPVPPDPMRETADERAERDSLARQHRHARYFRRLPKRYAEATLRDLDNPEQNPDGKVSGWLDSGHQTLLLTSAEPGLGKTHAAYAVGRFAVDVGQWVEAWTSIDLLATMRREMRSDETRDQTLDDVVACDLFILDDLGKENLSAWALEQIHFMIDTRLSEERRTIITTNLGSGLMGERYGYPLLDRIVDDAVIVRVTGTSRRKAAIW